MHWLIVTLLLACSAGSAVGAVGSVGGVGAVHTAERSTHSEYTQEFCSPEARARLATADRVDVLEHLMGNASMHRASERWARTMWNWQHAGLHVATAHEHASLPAVPPRSRCSSSSFDMQLHVPAIFHTVVSQRHTALSLQKLVCLHGRHLWMSTKVKNMPVLGEATFVTDHVVELDPPRVRVATTTSIPSLWFLYPMQGLIDEWLAKAHESATWYWLSEICSYVS